MRGTQVLGQGTQVSGQGAQVSGQGTQEPGYSMLPSTVCASKIHFIITYSNFHVGCLDVLTSEEFCDKMNLYHSKKTW